MNIAVIFAGGIGSRMKTKDGTPKQFLEIEGVPILIHTLRNFQNCETIDKIVVVMKEGYLDRTKALIDKFEISKVERLVVGGETGQESIYHGLLAANELSESDEDIVLIHDGVRPFIDEELINNNIDCVKKYGSSISCAPSKETIIEINDDKEVNKVIDRTKIWLARAPQSFYLKDILSVHEEALKQGITNAIDSCTMMMDAGKKLHMVETDAENIKITTPEDFYVAKGLIARREANE